MVTLFPAKIIRNSSIGSDETKRNITDRATPPLMSFMRKRETLRTEDISYKELVSEREEGRTPEGVKSALSRELSVDSTGDKQLSWSCSLYGQAKMLRLTPSLRPLTQATQASPTTKQHGQHPQVTDAAIIGHVCVCVGMCVCVCVFEDINHVVLKESLGVRVYMCAYVEVFDCRLYIRVCL